MKRGVLIFLITFLIYLISGKGQNPGADYFLPLARAFLHGQLYVNKMTYYLHEMVTPQEISTGVFNDYIDGASGKYYVIFPPLPAILLIPFVILFGSQTSQSLFSILIASFNVLIAFKVFRSLKLSDNKSLWLAALFAFGSMQWYHAVIGSGWYLSLICAMFFLLLAIWATIKKKNCLLIGFLVGGAYLCRFSTILSLPFFIIMTKNSWWQEKKINLSPLILLLWGAGFCLIISFAYNLARYGTITHLGYTLLEKRYFNVNNEYQFGSYSLTYFSRHLKAMFWSFPKKINYFPYFSINYWSMALWLVIPALFLVFWAPLKEKIVWASWLAILFILPSSLFHGGIGASQFGYRYALDFLPFLFLIISQAIRKNFYWWQKSLIILSIFINFWGIYCSFWLS